jgi:hypothetical protein
VNDPYVPPAAQVADIEVVVAGSNPWLRFGTVFACALIAQVVLALAINALDDADPTNVPWRRVLPVELAAAAFTAGAMHWVPIRRTGVAALVALPAGVVVLFAVLLAMFALGVL